MFAGWASVAQASTISGTVSNNSGQPGDVTVELFMLSPSPGGMPLNIGAQGLGPVSEGSFQLPGGTTVPDGSYYIVASVDTAFDGPILSPGEPFTVSSQINIVGGQPVQGIALDIATSPPANTIETILGNGLRDPASDGIPALDAAAAAYEMVADQMGNIYFSDRSLSYDRVRKIDTNGIITTIAGIPNGATFQGDGGPAFNAALMNPRGLAIDDAGNLYISERDNNAIRKIDTNGIITTVAGIKIPGKRGGIKGGGAPFQGDGGPALNASILGPLDIAFDGQGNLYIAEYGAKAIRKISSNGIITTVAGDGSGAGSTIIDGSPASMPIGPFYLATGPQGRIYFSNRYDQVLTIDGMQDYVVTSPGVTSSPAGQYRVIASNPVYPYYYVDGHPAINTVFRRINSVEVDKAGNIYIADSGDYRIRKIDSATGIVSTVAGNGARGSSGDGGPAMAARIGTMQAIALDAGGNLYIPEYDTGRIRKVAKVGALHGPAPVFSGTVTYSNGMPAIDAYVTVFDMNAVWDPITGQPIPAPVSVYPDANGNYQLYGIAPGTYVLDVSYFDPVMNWPIPDFPNGDTGGPIDAVTGQIVMPPAMPTPYNVGAGEQLTVNVQLYNPAAPPAATTILGTVSYFGGSPAQNAYVTAYDVNAVWDPVAMKMIPEPISVLADANGNYQFADILPGTYWIEVLYFNPATSMPEPMFPNGAMGGPLTSDGKLALPPLMPGEFSVTQGQVLTVNAQL